MAAAASNKTTSKKDIRFPEIEEEALQFILDSCESSISKYSRFIQVTDVVSYKVIEIYFFCEQNITLKRV